MNKPNPYDTPEAEKAREAFLTMYELARGYLRSRAPIEANFKTEVAFASDPLMRDSKRHLAVKFAKKAMRTSHGRRGRPRRQ